MIPPLENLKFWAGAGLVALVLSSSHLLDGPSEIEAAQATEANRQDALTDALAAAAAHGLSPKASPATASSPGQPGILHFEDLGDN